MRFGGSTAGFVTLSPDDQIVVPGRNPFATYFALVVGTITIPARRACRIGQSPPVRIQCRSKVRYGAGIAEKIKR